MRFHALYHVPFENCAALEPWIVRAGHTLSVTKLWENQKLPSVEAFDFLIVMGGPMNIYEEKEYPWLKAEKEFIRQAVQTGKKVLGICLGAQLISDVLGGRVFRNPQKEIGWWPVEFLPGAEQWGIPPGTAEVFHWHGDTFPLPPGAVLLARSAACANQAFIYENRVMGLQFHLEATEESVKALAENCGDELVDGAYIQKKPEVLGNPAQFKAIHELMGCLLTRMIR